ncbi:MAG: rhamnose/proton symporter RhaT [Kiritimatiellae bacterium]|nr:rhamnose/proton symporter RhaT [Kiritimatiellia bacterium]
MNTVLGMLVFALGGLAGATFSLPFRKVKGVAYESYWLVYAVAGLILFPLALGLATVPGLFGVIGDTPAKTLLACAGFGAMWGVGGLTWGLMIRYLGVGLGLAIGCGLCSATGTLLPPIFKGEAATLVLDAHGDVSIAKIITLVGVALSLAGIVFVGLAGKSKEGELDEETKKAAVAEFDFKKGIIVALVSGVFSGCMNFGLSSGDVMAQLAEASGAGKWWIGVPVLIVVLWGGFVVNAAYCLAMNRRNGTFGDYGKLFRGAGLSALALSAFAGVIWALQFAFLKMGEPLCGDLAYIGFAVVMGASVMFSSLLGVMLGEWKGVGAKTRRFLATGLVLLAVSIVVPVVSKALESVPERGAAVGAAADKYGGNN